MSFFQVQLLRQMTGAASIHEMDEFWSVVNAVKAAGPAIKNASYILAVDETPLPSCNEIPVNAANGSKILQYLIKHNGGSVNPEALIGCAIRFGYREYPDFQDPITGGPQIGLSIKEIEPYDNTTGEPMLFDQTPESLPDWVTDKEPTKAELKRAQLRERLARKTADAPPFDAKPSPAPAPKKKAKK